MEGRATSDAAAAAPRLRGSYRLFRIFGFEVKLNLTWLLLALLITWTLAAGLFPADYPGLAPGTYWWMGLAGAFGILLSIVFHELTHSLVARRLGVEVRGITLFIFGGVAEMEAEPPRPGVEFPMAVAGPIASLLLAGVFQLFERLAGAWALPVSVGAVAHYLSVLNLVLAAFNLVPAFPLDGGRMLRAVLWHATGDLSRATRVASRIGSGFGIALMVLGGLAFIQGSFIAGMWWILIGAFVRSAATGSYRHLLVRKALTGKRVRELMTSDPITVGPDATVEQLLEEYVYRHHHKLLPVVAAGALQGCVSIADIKRVPREHWPSVTVSEIATPCSDTNTVAPDTRAEELLAAIARPGAGSRFMVVEEGRLIGVVSLRDLTEYVKLKLDIESPQS